ncbi:hypothetical protein H4Q26_012006 [Puccinia striiformis f. sp. tritici PST-130]|nr:hypothetical protein H4Q26_012006 [Puccinia striiformis f. sp. tritici PST-130]
MVAPVENPQGSNLFQQTQDTRLQQMSDELQSSEPDLTAEYGVRSVGFRTNMARWIQVRQQARHNDIFMYFRRPQNSGDTVSYQCLWCSQTIRAPPTSCANLRQHRDGSNHNGRIILACPPGSGQFCTVAIYPQLPKGQVQLMTTLTPSPSPRI